MDFEEYTREKLWPVLIETVHALVMYSNHKVYARETVLPEKPETSPAELAARLRIPFGEALVIICELTRERRVQP
jgi:hypothetical protein